MAAPVVVEVPAIGALLAGMGALLCLAAAYGLLLVWRRSLGPLMVATADQLDRVGVRVLGRSLRLFGSIASLLRATARNVDSLLAEAVNWSGKGATVLFSFFLTMQLWVWQQMSGLALDTYHAIRGVRTTVVNTTTKVVNQKVVKPITRQTRIVKEVSTAQVKALRAQVRADLARMSRAVAIPAHAVAGLVPRVGRLERRATNQAKRLGKLEKATVGALGAAAVLAAVKRLGLGWTRCNNVGKVGKRVCGMDTDLLESLLGGSLLLLSAISIEQLARELAEPTELVTDGMRSLVREF